MSFLGGKQPAAATPNQLNSINVDQSRYGDPIPLVYGVQRIPMTLLWYGAFSSSAQYSGGGKGGRGSPSSYNYSASCVMGLCEGPITAIKQVWKDKDITTLATEGLTAFLGAGGQAPWSYLSSNFPAQAVPYDHTAYVAEANLALGSSAALPNYTFEVQAFLSLPGTAINFASGIAASAYSATLAAGSVGAVADGIWDVTFSDNESRTCTFSTVSGTTTVSWDSTLGLVNAVTAAATVGGYDARADEILIDYCTDVNHGCGFLNVNQTQLQSHTWTSGSTTYSDSWRNYCIAMGLFFSPYEDTQRAATDFIKDLLEMTNSSCVMSAGSFKVVPYGDSIVTGNGQTYTPNLQPLFTFTDDDFMPNNQGTNNDPVVMERKSTTETYNVVRVEFLDRGNSYNTALAEWTDPLDISQNGIRVMSNKTFHQICDARVASQVAALIGQRQLYIRNTYQFTVRADYSFLEPLDLIAITDSNLGVTNRLLRIIETEDDQNDLFTITAEEMFVGTASAPKYNFQAAQGYAANFGVAPFSVATPLVFSAPPALIGANGGYQLWIAVGSSGETYTGSTSGTYGGCDVYGSLDGTTYNYVGRVSGQARYGAIPSNVGASDSSITVTLNAAGVAEGLQLNSASASDYANNRSLIYLDGEIIGFENATLIGSGEYTLSPVTRGLYGTGPSAGVGTAHAAGAQWARLDEYIMTFPFDAGMVGQTIDLKFTAFNSVGRAEQTLAEATAYACLIETQSVNQLIGAPVTLRGSGVSISGTSAFKTGSAAAWDSGCWSVQGYTDGAFISFSPSANNAYVLMGLHSAAGLVADTALDYAFFCTNSGALYGYESGTEVALSSSTYAPGDVLLMIYDGAYVYYYQNGTQVRKVAVTGELTFYLNSSFFTPGVKVSAIQVGPYGSGGAQVYTVASAPAIVLAASSSGVVTSFATANGILKVYQNGTDITASCALSIPSGGAVSCTGTVNSAANTPVSGQPIGYYQITAMTADTATLTIQATYDGTNYDTLVTFALSIAGATGATGATGPQGPEGPTGGSGTPALSIILSDDAATVFAYADGSVPSWAGISGTVQVLSGNTDITSSCSFSSSSSTLTGSVNTAANTPVSGEPIGFYEVTAMSGTTGALAITASYSGASVTKNFTVTKVETGYEIVSSLPTTFLYNGRTVFDTTNGVLYTYSTTSSSWVNVVNASNLSGQLTASQIASISAAQVTGQITGTQISNGAISTPQLAAGAVTSATIAAGTITASNIAASTITSTQLAANSVTASQLAANSVTTNAIQAGAVTAAQIGVTELSAMSANLGAVNAGTISFSSVTSYFEFNNGSYMKVSGVGFGAGSDYLEWFGPTQSSASNFAACTDALGVYWLKTDGTAKFGATQQAPSSTRYVGSGSPSSATVTVPPNFTTMWVELWGDTQYGAHGNTSGVGTQGGGGGSGGYCRSQYPCASQDGNTLTVDLYGGYSGGYSSTVTAGTFTGFTTMSAPGAGTTNQPTVGGVSTGGMGGQGAGAGSGGNVANVAGNDGKNGQGSSDSGSFGAGGAAVPGLYGSGYPGANGSFSNTTNNPGNPAVCVITFT